jgi:hypothetical protein
VKTLSSATVEQEIIIAAEKGPDAVRDVCALTDDSRLAFLVSQFAPSKIRIGSAHVKRRAKVHAALVAEQTRRKGQGQ